MLKWIKVRRLTDGLVMQIPETAYGDKYFELIEDDTQEATHVVAEVDVPVTAVDENAEVVTEDNEEELRKLFVCPEEVEEVEEQAVTLQSQEEEEEEEVKDTADVPVTTWTSETLKPLTYTELKDAARKLFPALRGNVSKKRCYGLILGTEEF